MQATLDLDRLGIADMPIRILTVPLEENLELRILAREFLDFRASQAALLDAIFLAVDLDREFLLIWLRHLSSLHLGQAD